MSESCFHTDLMIHAFIELQMPYYLNHGEIDHSDIDDTPVVGPQENAQQVGERHAQVLDWRWEASGAQLVECRQIALPTSAPGDPCYDIEYDQAYWGGLYSNVPEHAYLPVALIEAVGLEA